MLKTIGIILGIVALVIGAYFTVYAYVLSAFFERGTIEVGEVKRASGLVGTQFISDVPLVYIKNLPYFEDVDSTIVFDTPTVLTRKTSYELSELRNICTNCLDAQRLVTDIRVEFIPVGTALTVVEEFLQINRKNRGLDETVHVLIVEEEQGTQSEITKLNFELFVLDTQGTQFPWGSESETMLQNVIEILSESETVQVEHCFRRRDALASLEAFVNDFNFRTDIQFVNDATKGCSVITYNTLDAFMTAHYYLETWGLDGNQAIVNQ